MGPNETIHPDTVREIREALRRARHVVIFTGAGVSAESGIPTFRDALTGLWERFDARDLATPAAFLRDPALVWGWYEWRRMGVLKAKPNQAHRAIAELARRVPRLTLITQNVDDLHERAGSTDVIHLHGILHQPRCFNCHQPHALPPGAPEEPHGGRRLPPPTCPRCAGLIRPGVVWFGESLPEAAIQGAFQETRDCDLMFVVGTSGLVYPAAQLPRLAYQNRARIVQINPQVTQVDPDADWVLRSPAGIALSALLD